jgi:hypothetical protein
MRRATIAAALVAAAAVLLATSIFGVGRDGILGSHDFTYFTAAGEAWLAGESPYIVEQLNRAAARYYAGTGLDVRFEFPLFYPPQFFPIAALAGSLGFDASRYAIAGITIAAIGALGAVCAWVYRVEGGERRTILGACAVALALAQAIGNPFGSSNIWMGQTSALAGALMLGGWMLACRGRAWVGAAVIALGCFKPTLGIALIPLAVVRWPRQTLIVMPIVGLTTAAYPLLTQGPVEHTRQWLAALGSHADHVANHPDFRHYFGLQSLVRAIDIPAPGLWPLAAAAGATLLLVRKRLSDAELAVYAIAVPMLLYKAHDYDLVVMSPLAALLAARASRSPLRLAALALGVLVMFIPLRLVQRLDAPAVVERYREIVVLVMAAAAIAGSLSRRRPQN